MAIQDPSDNEMERRLLFAMVLSMAVLFLVPTLYNKVYPPATQQHLDLEQVARPKSQPLIQPTESLLEVPAELEVETTRATPQVIELENKDLILRWNNSGAVLESARLRNYLEAGGNPVELLHPVPLPLQRAFSIRSGRPDLDERLSRAVYEVRRTTGSGRQPSTKVELYYRDEVVEVRRTIRVPDAGYVIEIQTQVALGGRSIPFNVFLGPGIGSADSSSSTDFANPTIVYYKGGASTRNGLGDVEEGPVKVDGPARWVALDSKYFTCLVLDAEEMQGAEILSTEIPKEVSDEKIEGVALIGVKLVLGAGSSFAAFIGPKDYEILKETDETLVALIDYGHLDFLVKPLLFALKFIYGYVNNYGWSIIILTFAINLVLFPVRYKQMVSMKKMARLQPQMKTIQAKYKKMKKGDPRRTKMNEEVMALYKTHGVNPLGGCLPLVIQMPFLFAFYTMLSLSIELRGAPFLGWILDLSRHDPYYVTPIVMGLTMVAQQKMTPAAGDPTQRRMMMFLPIIFTFFFLSFSSGLVLYFLFSNVFGMMLQFLMQGWDPGLATTPPGEKAREKKRA